MKLTRTLAERVIMNWHERQGYHVHRAEASFRRIPVGGACGSCHRRYEKTFSVSHDLFGIFDGVSVARGRARVWWQVTTVSRADTLGPRGGSRPNFNNVSKRKRKIEQLAPDFAPDLVLIFGASAVRQGRSFRRFFMVWRFEYATGTWTLLPQVVDVQEDAQGKPYVPDAALWAFSTQEAALQGAPPVQQDNPAAEATDAQA